MGNLQGIANIFDEWEKTLTPSQQLWCREAVKNATADLKNVGEESAKKLIISVLLFCNSKRIRGEVSQAVGSGGTRDGGHAIPN